MRSSSNDPITDYWHRYYAADHCTLCGNHGIIDTTGVRTPAGVEVGRVNYCICPNGQSLRAVRAPDPLTLTAMRLKGGAMHNLVP